MSLQAAATILPISFWVKKVRIIDWIVVAATISSAGATQHLGLRQQPEPPSADVVRQMKTIARYGKE
jgi:hypothetical protein